MNWLSFSQEVGLTRPMHSHYSRWTMVYEKLSGSHECSTQLYYQLCTKMNVTRYQLVSAKHLQRAKGAGGWGLYPRRKENRSTGAAAVADTTFQGNGMSKGKPVRTKQGADVGSAEWSL